VRILVVYASRAGSTKGIAEFIAEKLKEGGAETVVQSAESKPDLDGFDAFVIGSALYQYHWLKEAKEFVFRNRAVLANRPVWLFSSGPTGSSRTDKKGRDLLEVSGPKEIGDLREWAKPRDHRVFFGAFFPERVKGAMGLFARMVPKDQTGDFRDWKEIEDWAREIATRLPAIT